MDRKQCIQDILADAGISLVIQECYTDEELYSFALEICLTKGESLEDILSEKVNVITGPSGWRSASS